MITKSNKQIRENSTFQEGAEIICNTPHSLLYRWINYSLVACDALLSLYWKDYLFSFVLCCVWLELVETLNSCKFRTMYLTDVSCVSSLTTIDKWLTDKRMNKWKRRCLPKHYIPTYKRPMPHIRQQPQKLKILPVSHCGLLTVK